MSRSHSLGATLFYDEIEQSRRRTKMMLVGVWLLLSAIAFTFAAVFGAFNTTAPCVGECVELVYTWTWRPVALALCFGVPAVYMALAWLWSSRAALFISGAHATEPGSTTHVLLEKVSIAAGIPTPTLWLIDDPAPNAFATGRNVEHSHVAVTSGLVEMMDDEELEGVLAHEVSHIANRDVQITTVAVLAAGLIAGLAELTLRLGSSVGRGRGKNGGQLAVILLVLGLGLYILAVPAAFLLRAGISRSRESLADASAVEITRNPAGLRSALQKLHQDGAVVKRSVSATNHLWIESPTDRSAGRNGLLGRLMNTHPPLEERIEKLGAMLGL